ncbi:MAG TPA: hypothetical protein VEJ63_23390 [Planctomycetota bacterium]|nr:hypothetical protein [Planctomycetota bacterium]
MRSAFFLSGLILIAAVLQAAVFPGLLPPVLRPDACVLLGIAVLAFAPRETGLIAVFLLGIVADLFSSGRFGLLTVCYMLSSGIILWAAWRELTRGDVLGAWIGGLAATILAHALYIFIARRCGFELPIGQGFATTLSLVIAGAVWGLPLAYSCGRVMYSFGVVSPEVREKWAAQARLSAARRGKALRV